MLFNLKCWNKHPTLSTRSNWCWNVSQWVDENRNISHTLPTFHGHITHLWRRVHTVKFVFETVGWIKFEANLKEQFDLHLL